MQYAEDRQKQFHSIVSHQLAHTRGERWDEYLKWQESNWIILLTMTDSQSWSWETETF